MSHVFQHVVSPYFVGPTKYKPKAVSKPLCPTDSKHPEPTRADHLFCPKCGEKYQIQAIKSEFRAVPNWATLSQQIGEKLFLANANHGPIVVDSPNLAGPDPVIDKLVQPDGLCRSNAVHVWLPNRAYGEDFIGFRALAGYTLSSGDFPAVVELSAYVIGEAVARFREDYSEPLRILRHAYYGDEHVRDDVRFGLIYYL